MPRHKIPTVGEMLAAYPAIAALEKLRNGRPTKRTIANVLTGVKRVGEMLALIEYSSSSGIPLTKIRTDEESAPDEATRTSWMKRPLSWFGHRRIEKLIMLATELGVTPLTAWSYVSALKGLTARWCQLYYLDRGWKVESIELPTCRRRAPRYQRPEREILLKVKEWYENLWFRNDKRDWLAATLMLEFAMRNGDVGRLRWSDFRLRKSMTGSEETLLCYTPHKTSLSSGRIVAWPVHPELWARMERVRQSAGLRLGTHFQGLVVPAAHQVFMRLNADLRSRHFFRGGKAAYELRKICIDHIYQKFGAEMASSISGDDIRTVTHYYADPSAVNAGAVRIVEML